MLKKSLVLVSCLIVGATVTKAQPIWINCQAQDYQSKQLIPATWQWSDLAGRLLISQKAVTAGFSGLVPGQARYLTVTSNGYRLVKLPLQWHRQPVDSVSFHFIVPLVPIDKQTMNQPYFQSEQKPLQLGTSSVGNNPVRVRFLLLDALTSRPVRAELCLFFTKKAKRTCSTTTSLQTTLMRSDIIAIEAQAEGYQPYLGNLVVSDSVNVPTPTYTIRLNPTPTLLVGIWPASITPTNGLLKPMSGSAPLPLVLPDNSHFFVAASPGLYRLTANVNSAYRLNDTIRLARGLTSYIASNRGVETVENSSVEYTIYFGQSSYMLPDSAHHLLDRVARLLQQNPHRTIRITGHTDNIGNLALNVTLSEFRAKIIKAYLRQRGIPENRLLLDGVGASQPAFPNDTEDHRRHNRRASLLVY